MLPAEALERIRGVGERAQESVPCPACGARRESPCAAAPPYFHEERFLAALASADPYARCPQDFDCLNALVFAAHPLPRPCEPEQTDDGRIVLWRVTREQGPWLGRGSYWMHDRRWGEFFLCNVQLASPWRAALWRAEVKVGVRNSYDQGVLDMTTGRHGHPGELDLVMREHADWPGRTWLVFAASDRDNAFPLCPERDMTQYVYCGRRPVKAERAT